MSYIISFILPIIYILFFTYSLSMVFKTKFEYSLPFTFILSGLSLFISLFVFKTIYVGFILCILFSLIFPIHLYRNKYSLQEIKDKYLTNGVIAFICLYIIVYLYDLNRSFTRWDELSHWGKMVKEIIRLDNFYSIEASHLLVHKDYPPIFSLMESFYILISGGFRDSYLIRCIHLFEGSIILSLFKHKSVVNKKSTIIKTILTIILFYLLTFFFDSEVFINSIYLDYPLALLTAYGIYNVFKEKNFSYLFFIKISVLLIFMVLSKQVGIPLALIIVLFLIIRMITSKVKDYKKILFMLLMIIVIPFTMYKSWDIYTNNLGLVGQFETSDIHVGAIPEIINKTGGEDWQQETSFNYMNALFLENITASYLKFTYFGILLITLLLIYVLRNNLTSKIDDKQIIGLIISLIVGYLGYALMMYLLYVFNFGPFEGPSLASFDRYMSTYALIIFYSVGFIFIHYNKFNWKYVIPLIVILAVIIPPKQYLRLRPDLILLPNHLYDNAKEAVKVIDSNINVDDKVLIIDQAEKNGGVFYVNYYTNKAIINRYNYEVTDIKNNVNLLGYYDYVYTYSLLTNELDEHTLYKVETINGKLELVKVN